MLLWYYIIGLSLNTGSFRNQHCFKEVFTWCYRKPLLVILHHAKFQVLLKDLIGFVQLGVNFCAILTSWGLKMAPEWNSVLTPASLILIIFRWSYGKTKDQRGGRSPWANWETWIHQPQANGIHCAYFQWEGIPCRATTERFQPTRQHQG